MAQVVEHFFVQQPVTQLAVKALGEAILMRLAWVDIMPADLYTVLPLNLGARHKLCPIVRHDHLRFPVMPDDPIQLTGDMRTGQGCVRDQHQTFTAKSRQSQLKS
jgi:hypothetical protein